jgi:hypothetical protein
MIDRQIREFAEKAERVLADCLRRMTPAERALTEKRVAAFWAELEKGPTKSDIRAEATRTVWKRRKKLQERGGTNV